MSGMVLGIIALVWGLYECYSRNSWHGESHYTPEANGAFFWIFALVKVAIGILLIYLSVRRFA